MCQSLCDACTVFQIKLPVVNFVHVCIPCRGPVNQAVLGPTSAFDASVMHKYAASTCTGCKHSNTRLHCTASNKSHTTRRITDCLTSASRIKQQCIDIIKHISSIAHQPQHCILQNQADAAI